MGLLTFFGCLLTAYGPPMALFLTHVSPQAHLVILFVMSAFFWLFSMLFASVFWYIIPPMWYEHAFIIFFSVLFQEVFRWCYYLLYAKTERGLFLVAFNPKSPYNRAEYAFVSGFGFGFMSSLLAYISALAESVGPGFLSCPACPSVSTYFIYAVTTLLFDMLHIMWMMVAFEGFHAKDWRPPVAVALCHLGASYLTLINSSTLAGGCALSIMMLALMLVLTAYYVWRRILMPVRRGVMRQQEQHALLE